MFALNVTDPGEQNVVGPAAVMVAGGGIKQVPSFAIKISIVPEPELVKGIVPKEIEGLLKYPEAITFPEASSAIDPPTSIPVPPIDFAQTKLPEVSNLEIKISELPTGVKVYTETVLGSKSAVPSK